MSCAGYGVECQHKPDNAVSNVADRKSETWLNKLDFRARLTSPNRIKILRRFLKFAPHPPFQIQTTPN